MESTRDADSNNYYYKYKLDINPNDAYNTNSLDISFQMHTLDPTGYGYESVYRRYTF